MSTSDQLAIVQSKFVSGETVTNVSFYFSSSIFINSYKLHVKFKKIIFLTKIKVERGNTNRWMV